MEERIFTEFEQKQIDTLDRTVYNLIESSREVIFRAIMDLRVPSDIDIESRVDGIIASYKRAYAFIKG
ncbi:hypothetical protein Ah1_00008 [Aeromonas phage Ah1]|uniref:Uncharacterized protein n=1 Tax=Aeromonas phage Ah1 TaxID=2053701 RepID=A0A2H4YEF2_9CAUD|nr:hypothetical protein KNT77_gp008 [Aeromonas phage Ah1]AUE22549.1 hypothetical protein Ah1_00008 [Aeromonas phage Ah1]UYD60066.1 hypothetical protein OPFAMLBM_00045 [Aeromonas phage avDM12-TAAL]